MTSIMYLFITATKYCSCPGISFSLSLSGLREIIDLINIGPLTSTKPFNENVIKGMYELKEIHTFIRVMFTCDEILEKC